MAEDTDSAALIRWHALFEEVKTAVGLLKAGLAAIQQIDGGNDFFHLPMLLLATGYERLMKCVYCLAYQNGHGKYPSEKALRAVGHDLVQLRDWVATECFVEYAEDRPCGREDLDYITGDSLFCDVLDIISTFAKSERYYNLALICGAQTLDSSGPDEQFARVEIRILTELGLLARLREPSFNPYQIVNNTLVVSLERFARAICRLFTLADLGDDAERLAPLLRPFLTLRDDQLGTTDYNYRLR